MFSKAFRRKGENEIGCILAVAAAIAIFAVLFLMFCIHQVPNGHVGVKSYFSQVQDDILLPGIHVVSPAISVKDWNTQSQIHDDNEAVPTKDNLSVNVKATLVYHLNPTDAPKVVREIKKGEYEPIIERYFQSALRDATGKYQAVDLQNENRIKVEEQVVTGLRPELEKRGFVIEQVMILNPVMPEIVKQRIEAKVGAEQDSQRMEFVLKQKSLEAQAKVVEAKGIADAQNIIKKDLDHNYLVYLWIEALKESAKHNNATIYIPTGQDGMPFFANTTRAKP